MKEAYLVIDFGTGNLRVAVVQPDKKILSVERKDINYIRDSLYPESIYFNPEIVWQQIIGLGKAAIENAGNIVIKAINTTSQREGIVVVDKKGNSIFGMPNIDHRGREWENEISDKDLVYRLTGRFPTSLFSALKLVGIQQRRKEIWTSMNYFMSISDWIDYKLSGIIKYEHSQASETLLYNVQTGKWDDQLTAIFGISPDLCPPVIDSGSIIGKIIPALAKEWNISNDAVIVAGGGDTQLAIKSTQPTVEDFVIVSGTTTPIVKIVEEYILDEEERTWTSRHIEKGQFIFEANAGVTGLNYQRLKQIFYPNESYAVIEKELNEVVSQDCFASLGALIASEKFPITGGGFYFPVPISHELTRANFASAALVDIALSIFENYNVLKDVAGHNVDYIWACGGGLKSETLRKMIANISGKAIRVRAGSEQSSVVGGALLCNEAIGSKVSIAETEFEVTFPDEEKHEGFQDIYHNWKKVRDFFRPDFLKL